ncbi:MAG TPA: hypothetical protein VE377_12930 [Candidatus Dormibacteraeota bacterium]|nr:hypothetical protein [Candidatus Dormibacteraeota bacterium]
MEIRNVADPETVSRTLLLLPEDAVSPLSSSVRPLMDQLGEELRTELDTLGRTGSSKRVVNDVLKGTSVFSGNPSIVVPIYRYGAIPAVAIDSREAYTVAIFHRFRDKQVSAQPYEGALLERLESYWLCGLPLLLSHYCENIAARMHDVEWCRSTEEAWQECCRIRSEVDRSLFSKLRDVERGLKSRDPETRRFAAQLSRESSGIHAGKLAGWIALNLVERFCNTFSLRMESTNHSSLISGMCASPSVDFDGNIVLRGLRDMWAASFNHDVETLRFVATNTEPLWVREFAEFALAILALEGRASEQLNRDRQDRRNDWQRPKVFLSYQFESSPTVTRNVALLPGVVREKRMPFEVETGVAEEGDIVENVRLSMLPTSIVMPFLSSQSETSMSDYSWLIREIEHGLLCWKKIIPAIQEGAGVEALREQLKSFESWLFQNDPRVASHDARRLQVNKALNRAWVELTKKAAGKVDEGLLERLGREAVDSAVRKAEHILSYFLAGMDEDVRRWAIMVLVATIDGPKLKEDLLNSFRHHWPQLTLRRVTKLDRFSDQAFDQMRQKYYRFSARLLTAAGPKPIVFQQSKKYCGNLDLLFESVGLTSLGPDKKRETKFKVLRAAIGSRFAEIF